MIVEKVLEAKTQKIKQYPVNANRASELGHECLRYLVLNRTRWQEKTLHDARVQMIFDMGNMVEGAVENDLREAGFTIIEQHRAFRWEKYQATGSIDMKLGLSEELIRRELENGSLPDDVKELLSKQLLTRMNDLTTVVLPVEVKSSSPFIFDRINTIQDMKNHKYHYMRKYPAQLTMYLLMDGKELGLFLFKNKSTGELKEIWMPLDYELGESLIKKAELVNAHVATYEPTHILPDPMPYDEDICTDCGFNHICLPERIGKEVQVVDDERILELLTEREKLIQPSKDFDRIDKELKKLVHGKDKILVGDWFITGKWIDKATYEIPDEVKEKYKGNNPYWKSSFIKTSGEQRGENEQG